MQRSRAMAEIFQALPPLRPILLEGLGDNWCGLEGTGRCAGRRPEGDHGGGSPDPQYLSRAEMRLAPFGGVWMRSNRKHIRAPQPAGLQTEVECSTPFVRHQSSSDKVCKGTSSQISRRTKDRPSSQKFRTPVHSVAERSAAARSERVVI